MPRKISCVTTTSIGGNADRVKLPLNRQPAGFGPNGVVYLGVRDGTTAHLEKARVR